MIYFAVFGVLGLLTYKFERTKYKNIICLLAVIMISLLIGLRAPEIGNDTVAYHAFFTEFNNYDNFFAPNDFEYGFVLLMRLIGLFTDNSQIAILVIAFLTVTPVVMTIFNRSEMPWLSILLFFLIGIMGYQMNILRQALAMSILFAGSRFLVDRKVIRYIIVVCAAFLFHKTAIVALCVIPFLYLPVKNSVVIFVFILAAVVTLLFPQILQLFVKIFPKYEVYLDSSYFDGSGRLGTAFSLAILLIVFLLLLYYTNAPLNRDYLFTFNMYSRLLPSPKTYAYEWSFIILIAGGIVAFAANIMDRLLSYYLILMLLYFPRLAKSIESKTVRNTFIGLLLIVYIVKFIVIQVLRPEWNRILPYKFFWQV